jgi:hypothetical protein
MGSGAVAEAGTIQEFFVGLGFKIDESTQNRFRQGISQAATASTALQKQVELTAKSLTDLGTALKAASDEPVRKYEEGQRRIGVRQLDFLKITKEIGRVGVESATAFAAAIMKTAANYEQLFYIAQRTGSSVAGLEGMEAGFRRIGIAGDAALAAFKGFHAQLRDQPGLQEMLNSLIPPGLKEEVQKAAGGILSGEQVDFEAFIKWLGTQTPALRSQYAQMYGIDPDMAEQAVKNQNQQLEGIKNHAEALKRAYGGDAQTAVKRYEENAQKAVKLQQDWNQLLDDFSVAWSKSFGEAAGWIDKIVQGIDWFIQKTQEFNRERPGAALAEGLAVSYGAWKVASLAFGGLFKGLSSIFGGAKTAAAEATAEAEAATAAAKKAEAAATAAANTGIGKFRMLMSVVTAVSAAEVIAQAPKEAFDPHSEYNKKKREGITKDLDESTGGWFSKIFGAPERIHEAIFGKQEEKTTPAAGAETTLPDVNVTAPAPGVAANPMYPQATLPSHQKGGVIGQTGPAFLHAGEMVLPEAISRGLQGMIQAASQAGSSMREGASRAGEQLGDWLTGASGAVPNIAIANTEEFVTEFVRAFLRAQREAAGGGGGGEGGGGGATTMVPPAEPATPGGPTTAVPAGPTTPGGRAGAAAGGAVGAGYAAVRAALAPPGAAQPPSAGGIQVGAEGKVDPQQLYRAAVERYKNSPLNGFVPKDGPQFGITKGTPEEWARLSLAGAMQESSLNANEPGGGLFQFEADDLARYGVKGAVNDPNAQLEAQIRQYEGSIPKAGAIRGPDNTGAAAYFGSIRRPEETTKHLAEANRVAQAAQRDQIVPPPTMYTGTAPTTGETGREPGAQTIQPQVAGRIDTSAAKGVNKEMIAAQAAAMNETLPPGYTARVTSGEREEAGSQHALGKAADWQIYDDKGNKVSNRGMANYNMYRNWAVATRAHLMLTNPDLAKTYNWGGHFGTQLGGGGEEDLMHGDIGPVRGSRHGGQQAEYAEAATYADRLRRAATALQQPLPEHMKPSPVQVAANPMYPQADQAAPAAPAAPHLVSGLDHIDRAFADARLSNQTTNNTGHTFNEGDRNVSMNPVTNITINGGEGGAQDQSSRYSRASSRIYGDLIRNLKTSVA